MKDKRTLIIIPILLLLVIGYVVSTTKNPAANSPESSRTERQHSENTKSFTDEQLGFGFSYPAESEDVVIEYYAGTTGRGLQGSVDIPICNNGTCTDIPLRFGGITADFTAERGTAPAETGRFEKQGAGYYFRQSGGGLREIDLPVEEIPAQNTTGILLTGKEGSQELGATERKAVFNLHRSAFQAISFYWDSNSLPETQVNAVLETVVVKQ
jgi:hypothetical protein